MKNLTTAAIAAIFCGAATISAQVGINNNDPKATLEVTAKTITAGKAEGIIAPRLEGAEIKLKDGDYLAPQTGAIVYAKSASPDADVPLTKTRNITDPGYYYFDGDIWQAMKGGVSTADGNTLYNGSASVIKVSGSPENFQRAALTGDVSANQDANSVTVTGLQNFPVSETDPLNGQVLQYSTTAPAGWKPTALPLAPTVNDAPLKLNVNGTAKTDFTANAATGVDWGTIYAPTNPGANGQIIQSNGTSASWVNTSSFVNDAVLTFNVNGGAAEETFTSNSNTPKTFGNIYAPTTSPNANRLLLSTLNAEPTWLPAGTSNQVLQTNASGAPSWVNTSSFVNDSPLNFNVNGTGDSFTANSSTTKTIPSFYAPTGGGTAGQVLTSNGSGAPVWQNRCTTTNYLSKWNGTSETCTVLPIFEDADYFRVGTTANSTTTNNMFFQKSTGAFRVGKNAGTIGTNSVGFGSGVTASGDNSFAGGVNANATGTNSFAFGGASGGNATASGNHSIALGYYAQATGDQSFAWQGAASGHFSFAMGAFEGAEALALGSFAIGNGIQASTYEEIALGSYNIRRPLNNTPGGTIPQFTIGNGFNNGGNKTYNTAMTVLRNGMIGIGDLGAIDSNINATPLGNINPTATLDIGPVRTGGTLNNYLFGPGTGLRLRDGSEGAGKVLTSDANGFAMWQTQTKPFFYMPAMVIPLQCQLPECTGGTFTINLYQNYVNNFATTVKNTGAAALTTLASNQLDYYITYYDPAVFTNVSVDGTGKMTYTLVASPNVTEKTFMNIVFQPK
jgi:hypothetical protein